MVRSALLFALLLLAGCVSPATPDTPSTPAAPGRDGALFASDGAALGGGGFVQVAQADAPGGYALRVHEDRAYVATFTAEEGVSIFDVSDPADPTHVGGLMGVFARSVDVLDYGERTLVAIAGNTQLDVYDVTDPADPVLQATFPFGSHNVVAHADAHVVYNARNVQDGVAGAMEIIDASDPDAIVLHDVWTFPAVADDGTPIVNQGGCHDLTVWPERDVAYCAAYQQTLVLDIADPLEPTVRAVIDNELITSHHTAFPILGHDVLVIGDEWLDNFVWGCVGGGLPAGALWFYDMTVSPPAVLSYVQAPETTLPDDPALLVPLQGAMCTSHNGQELGAGTALIAYGWFHAGLALIDASDPRAPVTREVRDIGGAVGDARWDGSHVYAVDDQVGLTVLSVA